MLRAVTLLGLLLVAGCTGIREPSEPGRTYGFLGFKQTVHGRDQLGQQYSVLAGTVLASNRLNKEGRPVYCGPIVFIATTQPFRCAEFDGRTLIINPEPVALTARTEIAVPAGVIEVKNEL